jgi:hypothetical protein
LQERELIKMNSLRTALSTALEQRGVARGEAVLAAELGVVVFRQAFEQWISDPNPADWTVTVQRVREQLEAVLIRSRLSGVT